MKASLLIFFLYYKFRKTLTHLPNDVIIFTNSYIVVFFHYWFIYQLWLLLFAKSVKFLKFHQAISFRKKSNSNRNPILVVILEVTSFLKEINFVLPLEKFTILEDQIIRRDHFYLLEYFTRRLGFNLTKILGFFCVS